MSFTPSMAGGRANPAGSPGMGSGNVPFAPGVMSGNLGGGQPPLARQTAGPTVINIGQQGPPPEQAPGQVPQAGPQAPPQAAMAGPQMAELFINFLNAYMQALMNDTGKPIVGGIY